MWCSYVVDWIQLYEHWCGLPITAYISHLCLFAKHFIVKLAEMITVNFIQFNSTAEIGSVSCPGFHNLKAQLQLLYFCFFSSHSSFLLALPQEDDDGPLTTPEYDTISENGLLSRNEPIRSKVSKLTERLRKRYPTTSTGQSALTHPLASFFILLLYFRDEREVLYLSSSFHFPLSVYGRFLCVSTGNCSSCNAVFSVLKKRVRMKTCYIYASLF